MNQKKKYVKKQKKRAIDQDEQRPIPRARISGLSSDEEENIIFDFTIKEILHLWLRKKLPGLKLDLRNKVVRGPIDSCQQLKDDCQKLLSNNSLLIITPGDEQILTEQQIEQMNQKFEMAIFKRQEVQKVCRDINKNYAYPEIEQNLKRVNNNSIVISIQRIEAKRFKEWFEIKEKEWAQLERKKKAKRYDEQQQSQSGESDESDGNNNFYSMKKDSKVLQSQKNSRNQSERKAGTQKVSRNLGEEKQRERLRQKQRQKERQRQLQRQKERQRQRERQKVYQKTQEPPSQQSKIKNYVKKSKVQEKVTKKQVKIVEREFENKFFDEKDFRFWVKNNRILHHDSQYFCFQRQGNKVKVSLAVLDTANEEECKKKVEACDIYFKFSKVIEITGLNPSSLDTIKGKFVEEDKDYFSCAIVEGYSEQNVHEHKLRKSIAQNKIYKTKYRNRKFIALFLVGLRPIVEKRYDEIERFLEEIPEEDITQKFTLTHKNIKNHVLGEQQSRVKCLVQQVIVQKMKKVKEVTELVKIEFIFANFVVTAKIKFDHHKNFMQNGEDYLNQMLSESIDIHDVIDERDVTPELRKKYLLVKSQKDTKKWAIIADRRESTRITKQILDEVHGNKAKPFQVQIKYKKSRRQKIEQFHQKLISSKEVQTKNILDEIKINFEGQNTIKIIGYKTTVQFFSEKLKEFLQMLDGTFTEKLIWLNNQETTVLLKNQKIFKEKIYKQFELTFNLNKNIQYGAIISLGCEKMVREDSPLVIRVQKHKILSRMPKGTLFFFGSAYDLQFIKGDRDFLHIDAFFKTSKNLLNQTEDKSKGYLFLYSRNNLSASQITEFVSKKNTRINDKSQKSFAFIMPKVNKADFVKGLLSSFQKIAQTEKAIKFRVFILENSEENLKVSLQDLENINSQNKVRTIYYVVADGQQFYFSKSGEEKIEKALSDGSNKVYLTNPDLNFTNVSHVCYLQKMELIHVQSGKVTKLFKDQNGRHYFILNSLTYEIPPAQMRKAFVSPKQAQVSLGVYEIDFTTKKQTNLFSGFTRNLSSKTEDQRLVKAKIFINFDETINQVEIAYDSKEEAKANKACETLKGLIEDQKVHDLFKLENPIKQSDFEHIQQLANDFEVNVEWDKKLELKICSFDQANIRNDKTLFFYKTIEFCLLFEDLYEPYKLQSSFYFCWKSRQEFALNSSTVKNNQLVSKQVKMKKSITDIFRFHEGSV